MKLSLDLKTLVMIISTVCMLAGFYYNTQSRLDAAERQVQSVQEEIQRLNKAVKSLKRNKR